MRRAGKVQLGAAVARRRLALLLCTAPPLGSTAPCSTGRSLTARKSASMTGEKASWHSFTWDASSMRGEKGQFGSEGSAVWK